MSIKSVHLSVKDRVIFAIHMSVKSRHRYLAYDIIDANPMTPENYDTDGFLMDGKN